LCEAPQRGFGFFRDLAHDLSRRLYPLHHPDALSGPERQRINVSLEAARHRAVAERGVFTVMIDQQVAGARGVGLFDDCRSAKVATRNITGFAETGFRLREAFFTRLYSLRSAAFCRHFDVVRQVLILRCESQQVAADALRVHLLGHLAEVLRF
jgi:hypothetical protein